MQPICRRHFLKSLFFWMVAFFLVVPMAHSGDCRVQHPISPPDENFLGQCPVCGMVRSMWARTWVTFDPALEVSHACSFHCLADWILKSGRELKTVQLTVYHQPQKTIPAKNALIVIGSTAAGTMSPISKIVFADRAAAEAFARSCGGEVVDYSRALLAAKSNVSKENMMINARRIKKGTIVEPAETDNCAVCGMFPMRYPLGKCQIRTAKGRTIHFCSSQCLFAFQDRQAQYVDTPVTPFLVWVVDRTTGTWISGRTAFFVIGSSTVFGPMGHEAFPFSLLADAEAFSAKNGGTVAGYKAVTIDRIVPQWRYH